MRALPGRLLGPPRTLSGPPGGDRGGTPSLRNAGYLSFCEAAPRSQLLSFCLSVCLSVFPFALFVFVEELWED